MARNKIGKNSTVPPANRRLTQRFRRSTCTVEFWPIFFGATRNFSEIWYGGWSHLKIYFTFDSKQLTLKCRESEDNAPSVKSQGRTISKKTISDLAATEKIGLRLSLQRKNLSRKLAVVFEIEIFDQISLSSLSRHLRWRHSPCEISDGVEKIGQT